MDELKALQKRVQILEDIEGIRKLKSNYWWFLDTKQWDKWRDTFTDDFVFYNDNVLTSQGADAMVEFTSNALNGTVSAHQGHQYAIKITSPQTAVGRWILNDTLTFPDGTVARGYGYYLEDYEKGKDSKWRIKVLRLGYFRFEYGSEVPILKSTVPYDEACHSAD